MRDETVTERTRVGVVGCGFISGNHFNSWRELAAQGADLVAVCDLDGAKAKATAEQFGIANWYDSAEAMLAAGGLDLVDIVTQMRSHRSLVEATVGAGLATIVQKPFGVDLADCQAMVKAADDAGVPLAVHENFRFAKPNLMVTEAIESGAIGTPTWARISFRTGHDIYSGQPYLRDEEKFIVLDIGVHTLDLARVFLGEVEHVSAELQQRNPEVNGDDTATVVLRHRSGAVSVVDFTYESRRLPDHFPETLVEIEGTTGGARVGPGSAVEITSDGKLTTASGDVALRDWMERPWQVMRDSSFRTCEHIYQRFKAGVAPDVSGADNLKTYALAEAAYESAAAAGKPVAPRA